MIAFCLFYFYFAFCISTNKKKPHTHRFRSLGHVQGNHVTMAITQFTKLRKMLALKRWKSFFRFVKCDFFYRCLKSYYSSSLSSLSLSFEHIPIYITSNHIHQKSVDDESIFAFHSIYCPEYVIWI